MSRRIGRILIRAVVTLVMVAMLNFILFRIAPGDPARLMLGGARVSVTAEQIEAQRQRWGLDRPLFPGQVVDYLSATLHGDFGYSFKFRGRQVADLILERLPATILLVGVAQVIAIVIGVMLGIYAGWRRGGAVDHIATGASLALYSTPAFWLGMILVVIFSTALGWFPGYGAYSPGPITGSLGSLLDY
ncbi:MAG: ABC transporter permease, partial [Mesorhizobium sp.]|uniref:ABC transporter permease n=1 Tax=Mesorhizobium sp. TaxID=1871066 RepID=UPI0011F77888